MLVDIKDFEGLYAVTENGEIFSYPKRTNAKQGKWLKIAFDGRYKTVCLFKNGKKHQRLVHRLVAEAFCDNRENKPHVNHIDGNKTNNFANNLEWVTQSENMTHAVIAGLHKNSDKQKAVASALGKSFRKFTEDQVRKIRKLRDMGCTCKDIGHWFNADRTTISLIVHGKTYAEIV